MSEFTTPGVAHLADLAKRALASPSGLEVQFTIKRYGSILSARGAMRSFQALFANMRSAERRRVVKEAKRINKRVKVELLETPFDDLTCSRRELPDGTGFAVLLQPSYMMDFGEVIDSATGEPIKMFTKEAHLSKVAMFTLMGAAQNAMRDNVELVNPLSPELEKVWFEAQPDNARSWYKDYGLPLPLYVEDAHSLPASNDPNDIPMDEDIFSYGVNKDAT